MVNICYIRQKEQLGLGHAILATADVVGREPFAVLLPDDIIDSKVPALKQLLTVYERYQTNVVAVERVSEQDTVKYGIVEPKKISERLHQVLSLVEKPEPPDAPSNLGIVGRYILMPEVFDTLKVTRPGKKGEVQVTDALQLLLKEQKIIACEFEGVRYDTGTPQGWLEATIALALNHPDLGPQLREYLRNFL
jgi:UTP--glucose-1-phosphate uridylyltransferase